MTTENIVIRRANASGVDLTGKEGYAVKNATGLTLVTGIEDDVVGIVTKGDTGYSDVCIFGRCKALAGGTLIATEPIMPTTGGKAQADTNAAARCRLGLALEAGVTGDLVEVFVNPQHIAISMW